MKFFFSLHSAPYITQKFEEIQSRVSEKFKAQFGVVPETVSERKAKEYDSMFVNLKQVYNTEKNK